MPANSTAKPPTVLGARNGEYCQGAGAQHAGDVKCPGDARAQSEVKLRPCHNSESSQCLFYIYIYIYSHYGLLQQRHFDKRGEKVGEYDK